MMLLRGFPGMDISKGIRVDRPLSDHQWHVFLGETEYPATVMPLDTKVEVHESQCFVDAEDDDLAAVTLALKRADLGQQVLYVFRTEKDMKRATSHGLTVPMMCHLPPSPPPPQAEETATIVQEHIMHSSSCKIESTLVAKESWMRNGEIYTLEGPDCWTTKHGRFILEHAASFFSLLQQQDETNGNDDDDDDDDDDSDWMVESSSSSEEEDE